MFIPDILANSLFHELPRPPGKDMSADKENENPWYRPGTHPWYKAAGPVRGARPSPGLRSVFFRKRGERA